VVHRLEEPEKVDFGDGAILCRQSLPHVGVEGLLVVAAQVEIDSKVGKRFIIL